MKTMEEIRDALLEHIAAHEAECDDPNCVETPNAIAYLCHCVGIRSTQIPDLQQYMADYESRCPHCQHLRN